MTDRTRVVLASRGDALTPYLAAALERRFHVVARLDPELTRAQWLRVAASTFRPNRSAWSERFHKSALGRRLRTANAVRRLADIGETNYDVILQIHALFEVPSPRVVLYIDCTHRQSAQQWPAWNPLSGAALAAWYTEEQAQYQRAAHIFAFNAETRACIVEEYGIDPSRVTTTGVGANHHALPTLPAGRREKLILFVGNDFERKGGPDLLRAFEKVRAGVPDARLVLVGTRPSVPQQDGVEVLGRVHDRSVIDDLYARAAVLAMPSHFDPLPLVVLEAMAFGLPVVASRLCGIPEMVADGVTGELVDAGDVDALAGRLTGLLLEPERAARTGAAGRERVERELNWDVVTERMAPALNALP